MAATKKKKSQTMIASAEEMEKETRTWVELVRISPKVDAVKVAADGLLKKGGDLVIRKAGGSILVHLQHSH